MREVIKIKQYYIIKKKISKKEIKRKKGKGVSVTHTPIPSLSLISLILYFLLILQSNPDLSLNNSHSSSVPTNTGVNSSSPVGFKHTTTYSIIHRY